jgi:hypothetical protein
MDNRSGSGLQAVFRRSGYSGLRVSKELPVPVKAT